MKKLLTLALGLSMMVSSAQAVNSIIDQKSLISFLTIHALSWSAGHVGITSIVRGLFLALNLPCPLDKNVVLSYNEDEDKEKVTLNRKKGAVVSLFGLCMICAGLFGVKYSFDNYMEMPTA